MKINIPVYVALNKPKGYVCALKDNVSPTVMELIREQVRGLHIVGRLDKDTTGLLILTTDGNYTHNATHPKKHVNKTYEVTLEKSITDGNIKLIEKGMFVDHGETQLKPATIEVLEPKKVLLTISEGKFHQVKKMFAALDNQVIELHRVIFDKIDLRKLNIKEGEYIITSSLNDLL